MSRFTRFLILLLLIAVGFGATGCSKTVRIGAIVSETGAAESYGTRVRRGLELARDELNAAGGVKGRTVELVFKDDASTPLVGRQAAQELVEQEGLRLVIGAVTSPVTKAIAPICEEKGAILLSPTASAPGLTRGMGYVFRNYPSDILEGTSMADFARDLGIERMAIFAVANDFGAGHRDVFAEKYSSKYRQVVETFMFGEDDVEAIEAAVAKLEELEVEGVYIAAYVNDVATILTKMQEMAIEAVVIGTSAVNADVVRMAGLAAENLVYPQPTFDIDSEEPEIRNFVRAYRERWDDDPDTYSAHGYDALMVLARAIERADSFHPDNVKIGLLGIDDFRGASGITTFDDQGDVVQYPRIFIIRQGRPVPYDRYVEEGGTLQVPGRD